MTTSRKWALRVPKLLRDLSFWAETLTQYAAPLEATATWDPPAIPVGASQLAPFVTVTGAVVGDFAVVSFDKDMQGTVMSATVKSANTVEIIHTNLAGGGVVDLASGTLRVRVFAQ